MENVPAVDDLGKFVGKKDGEVKVFKNNNVPEAYEWKQQTKQWEKVTA